MFTGGFGASVWVTEWFVFVPVLGLLVRVSVDAWLPLGDLRLGSAACSD